MPARNRHSIFSPSLQNVAYGLLILVILAGIFKLLAPLLQPLFMAIFIHYISMPSVRWLIRHHVPSAIAHFITLVVILGIFIGFGWAMGEYLDELVRQLPLLQERFEQLAGGIQASISDNLPFLGRKLKSVERSFNLSAAVDSNLEASVVNFLRFISASLLTILYVVFIIYEKRKLSKRLEMIYGRERAKSIQEIGQRINDSIVQYLYVKFLASLMTAVLAIGVMLVFGLKLPFLWGSILFFANFIPYVGSIVAFMFPIGFGFLQFTNPSTIVAMAALFMVIDIFVGNYWEPRYAGYRLNISPLVIMLALAFWGWLWGFVGLVLSVPIMVSFKFVLENIEVTRKLATLISNE